MNVPRTYLRLATAALLLGCTPSPSARPPAPSRLATSHLPNVVLVCEKVVSGGLPEGDEAFAELATLGVRTIISVDGAQPDVEIARRHGMRYVHLPHGYDGIPTSRVADLTKAVHHLPGPIYIHCHHGKHRSPAAASVACVSAGLLSPEQALAVLQLAGTSEHYRGLYQAAADAQPMDDRFLEGLAVEFPESVELPPMAEAMVALEQTHDHLRQMAAAGWQPIARHPDLEAAHESLLLREHFTELLRAEDVAEEPEEFRQFLVESETAAMELETTLRNWNPEHAGDPPALLQASLDRVSSNCTACHQKFRDIPLGEK